jgi:dephospho-CoA kinase
MPSPSQPQTPVVGLVGGVGSGKTTLARWLSQRLRVAVIDADAAGHAALLEPDVRRALRTRFGPEIFDSEGAVIRSRLAVRVFGGTPRHREARKALEAIVHPVIRRRLEQAIAAYRARSDYDLILLDAAVMLEAGWNDLCDALVFVEATLEQRQHRVRSLRCWTTEELERREASQWPLDDKRAAADCVVDNSGDLESAGRQLLEFLQLRFPPLADRVAATAPGGAPASPCRS